MRNEGMTCFFILGAFFLCSCRSPSSKKITTDNVPEHVEYVPSYQSPSTSDNSIESSPNVKSSSTIDVYEEGLIDGEAAAEEDRLAGKQGMQISDDDSDDEDEYEVGYDDGYDE